MNRRSDYTITYIRADRLEFRRFERGNARWRLASISESVHQSATDGRDVRRRDTEGCSGETDVLDEPANFGGVQGHELVDLVHAGVAVVGAGGLAELAAAEQIGKVLVEMGQERADCYVSMEGSLPTGNEK